MNKYTKPNFESSAVITIDTQCDTLDGQPLEIPGTSVALPNIKKILDAYRQKIVLVEDAISGLYPRGKEEMLNIGVPVVNAEAVENAIIA